MTLGYLLLAALAAAQAAAPVPPVPAQAQHLSAVDLFDVADQYRAAGKIDDATTIYDALARDPDADVRAEARFRKGMMLADAKRYEQAAESFRALLDEKPGAARVRLELARVLAAMGDESAARRQLRQAEAGGLPPDVAVTVDQFARVIRSAKHVGGSVELAVAPDSNVNRATQSRTLDTVIAPIVLSRDARRTSGVGLQPSGQAFAKVDLAPKLALVPRVSSAANLYRDHEFDDISAAALLGLEWRPGKDRLSPSLGRTWRWYGGHPYALTWASSLEWLHPIGKRAQIVVTGSASRARYQRNNLQDGGIFSLTAALDRAIDARSGAELSLSATRQTARDPGYATTAGGLTLLAWRDLGAATVFASSGINRTESDARLFLFPERRREWLFTGRVGATFRQIRVRGFSPTVAIGYERNISTVGLYDYRRIYGTFGIVRSF